jgi:hypothetical protein
MERSGAGVVSTDHIAFIETVRSAFQDTDNFSYMYEALANGYILLRVYQGGHFAQIKTRLCETSTQNSKLATVVIERLKQKLRLPPQPLKELIESLGALGSRETVADEDKFRDFKKDFDAKFTDEENQEAFDSVQNALLNRKWLRDNHKTLETTAQTKKFHALANTYRLDGNLDEAAFMLEAYSEAIR